MTVFKMHGLKELWMQTGSGSNKTMLPIHTMCEKMGSNMCKTLLKCHIGSGCDYLSKVGTKKAALLAKPELNLLSFGESAVLDEHQINEAESYLVQVYNSRSRRLLDDLDIFDEHRVKHWKSTNSVISLPPTSYSIREGHIRRWWYIYKLPSNLINPDEYSFLDPEAYGWDKLDNDLIPKNTSIWFLISM